MSFATGLMRTAGQGLERDWDKGELRPKLDRNRRGDTSVIETSASAEDRLFQALSGVGAGYLVVVTGAGINLASGIPAFRGNDPDAVWSKSVMEMAALTCLTR